MFLLLGFVLSIGFVSLETSKWAVVRKATSTFLTLLRGLPEILVVFLIYFGTPEVLELLTGQYVEVGPFGCGVVALSFIFASYASQSLRGAIQAIPLGQLGVWSSSWFKPQLYFYSYCDASSMATRFTRVE